jgi:hypothetical protein
MAASNRSQPAARILSIELRLDTLKPTLRNPFTDSTKRDAAYTATYPNVPNVTGILKIKSGRMKCPAQEGGATTARRTTNEIPRSDKHQPPTSTLAGQLRGMLVFTQTFYSVGFQTIYFVYRIITATHSPAAMLSRSGGITA